MAVSRVRPSQAAERPKLEAPLRTPPVIALPRDNVRRFDGGAAVPQSWPGLPWDRLLTSAHVVAARYRKAEGASRVPRPVPSRSNDGSTR